MRRQRPDPDHADAALAGGRRRHRMFDRDGASLVLLRLIADEPRHGYDLIRAIEALSGGAYAPSPGVIYPTLTLLADMDLVEEGDGQGQRRTFHVTPAGQARLDDRAAETAGHMARLQALAEADESHPIRSAFQRLREAVKTRAIAGDLADPALSARLVDILDAAADAVAQNIPGERRSSREIPDE
jgi:DNA-binding PadR family transcriptional regulator